jgi:hypothetical protein
MTILTIRLPDDKHLRLKNPKEGLKLLDKLDALSE